MDYVDKAIDAIERSSDQKWRNDNIRSLAQAYPDSLYTKNEMQLILLETVIDAMEANPQATAPQLAEAIRLRIGKL